MSYDLAVWRGERPTSNVQALEEFNRRYDEQVERPSPPTRDIANYVAELLRRFPEISEPKGESSPWASAPLIGEATGDFIYFPMTYSGAEVAVPFCAEVAQRRGLVCFDPQVGELLPRILGERSPTGRALGATFPVEIFARGELPAICPRHGEVATETFRVRARVVLPGWLMVTYIVLALIPLGNVVKRVLGLDSGRSPVWGALPRCQKCRRARWATIASLAAAWGGWALLLIPVLTSDDAWKVITWIVAFLVLVVASVRANRPSGLTVQLSEDRRLITLKGVCETFMDQIAVV